MPVILCRGCSCSYRGFTTKHFPLNKDACVICGTHVVKGRFSGDAYLCIRHSFGQSKLMGKCCLCEIPVRKDENGKVADFMGSQGKLCNFCSFGVDSKRCSYVGKRIWLSWYFNTISLVFYLLVIELQNTVTCIYSSNDIITSITIFDELLHWISWLYIMYQKLFYKIIIVDTSNI